MNKFGLTDISLDDPDLHDKLEAAIEGREPPPPKPIEFDTMPLREALERLGIELVGAWPRSFWHKK
jgi:hypothetical protein